MQDNKYTTAGFFPRLAAYGIDRLILLAALLLVRIPAWVIKIVTGAGNPVFFRFTAADIVCYVLSAAYFVLLTYFTGSTIGKKLLRIHVERADGSALGVWDVICRETAGRYLGELVVFVGYLMVLVDSENRAFHDWMCGTRVVYDNGVVVIPRKKHTASPVFLTKTAPVSGAGYTIPGAHRLSNPEEPDADEDVNTCVSDDKML